MKKKVTMLDEYLAELENLPNDAERVLSLYSSLRRLVFHMETDEQFLTMMGSLINDNIIVCPGCEKIKSGMTRCWRCQKRLCDDCAVGFDMKQCQCQSPKS